MKIQRKHVSQNAEHTGEIARHKRKQIGEIIAGKHDLRNTSKRLRNQPAANNHRQDALGQIADCSQNGGKRPCERSTLVAPLAAAEIPDVLFAHQPGDNDREIDAAQQIGDYRRSPTTPANSAPDRFSSVPA